ncbi:ribonuclease H-like domain-containing protein, partial [Tanacetum coccineum]
LPDENQVMLKIPRKDNMYSFDLKNVVLSKGLTCLIAKATNDESNMWHGRLGHINFKTLNKVMKGNLVRGLPSKIFENDHTCVACQKGKQHKASLLLVKLLRLVLLLKVYIRRSEKKKKDKGKAIMIEDESVQKKSKKKGLVMKKLLDYKNRLMRKKEKVLQEMLKLPNNCKKNMINLERKKL